MPLSDTLRKKTVAQFVKYACVGVMNTLLTLLVILFCKDWLNINEWVSNAIGYVAGFINSFVWNKHWVFRSHRGIFREMSAFCIGFLVCYAIQFAVTWLLAKQTPLNGMEIDIWGFVLSGYGIATIIGMITYTIANFLYNKFFTFKSN